MQIALYSTILSRGGAERYIAYLSKYLSKKKIPHLLLLDREEITYQYGDFAEVVILRNHLKGLRLFLPNRLIDIFALVWIKKKMKISHLISGTDKSIINSLFVKECIKISICQNNLSQKYSPSKMKAYEKMNLSLLRKGFNNSDYKFSVSDGVQKSMIEFSIKNEIFRTRNCVDTDYFFRGNHLPTSTIRLINVGNLIEQKNQKLLLRIVKRLKAENFKVALDILGDGELKAELNQYIRELDLGENVNLLGFISKDVYLKTLKSADIFVLTSKYEGMPLAILEAMSIGLPIVANDCESGPREILDNGIFGKLIEFNNEEFFVKAIKDVSNNYSNYSNLSKQRSLDFDYNNVFESFLKLSNIQIQ